MNAWSHSRWSAISGGSIRMTQNRIGRHHLQAGGLPGQRCTSMTSSVPCRRHSNSAWHCRKAGPLQTMGPGPKVCTSRRRGPWRLRFRGLPPSSLSTFRRRTNVWSFLRPPQSCDALTTGAVQLRLAADVALASLGSLLHCAADERGGVAVDVLLVVDMQESLLSGGPKHDLLAVVERIQSPGRARTTEPRLGLFRSARGPCW